MSTYKDLMDTGKGIRIKAISEIARPVRYGKYLLTVVYGVTKLEPATGSRVKCWKTFDCIVSSLQLTALKGAYVTVLMPDTTGYPQRSCRVSASAAMLHIRQGWS